MSDAIREAFEAWAVDYTRGWYSIHEFNEDVLQFAWNAYKAALQSQTAPAVPDGWKLVPTEPTDDQLTAALHAQGDQINYDAIYAAMLAAAPQPDHSPDAGKVVQGMSSEMSSSAENVYAPSADGGAVVPVGWIWEKYGQLNFTAGTHHKKVLEADGAKLTPVYTHPAQPRNEVQAEALENFAKFLELACEDRPYETETYRQCSCYAKAQAARLRSNGGGNDE